MNLCTTYLCVRARYGCMQDIIFLFRTDTPGLGKLSVDDACIGTCLFDAGYM